MSTDRQKSKNTNKRSNEGLSLFVEFLRRRITDQRAAARFLIKNNRSNEAETVLQYDDFPWRAVMAQAACEVD